MPYDQARHLSAILPACASALGYDLPTPVHPHPRADQEALGIPDARSILVVLVDGLGFHNLDERKGHAPFLRSLLKQKVNSRPISTCLPSTTPVAMAAFGTGTAPGLTCMTAYKQLNAEEDLVCQLIQFINTPQPEDLQRIPTIFERLVSAGVRVSAPGMAKFQGSGLTRAALRGPDYIVGRTMADRVKAAILCSRQPGLTYFYIPDVDKAGHEYGVDSDQWVAALEKTDKALSLIRQNLPVGTVMVVTADHGMINSDPHSRIDIAQEPVLRKGIRLVAGEPRNRMLYVYGETRQEKDAQAEEVAARYRAFLGNLVQVFLKEEAIGRGFYGPPDLVTDRAREILGDVIVLAQGSTTLVDTRYETDQATRLPSVHGSNSQREEGIPFLLERI